MAIGIISPYPEFTAYAEQLALQMNLPIVVREGALQRGLYYANQLVEDDGVNIIIGRGATADFLEQKLDIPVVKIHVNNFDLLRVFKQANESQKPIVFIDHYENDNIYDISFISEVLQAEIIVKKYQNEKDITQHIHRIAKEFNPDEIVIVCTAQCMARTASHYGIESFLVTTPREAIGEALMRAKETSILYEREKLRQRHLEAIISYAFDGVVATDEEGNISVFNERASQIIGIKPVDVMGRKLSLMQHPFLRKLYGNGEQGTEKLITLGKTSYIVNRIPIENSTNSLVITFQETSKVMQLESQLRSELHHRRFYAKYSFDNIVYQSDIMRNTIQLAKKFSETESNVLVIGESGTGKELFAQSVHQASQRKSGPFIAINCAALPESLLESELFGYEEGAFTGARKGGKPGLFEMAHEGTLFLDEIGELPITLQARLLRVLQEKEVMRVGGERIIPINVRIIAATNRDLKKSIKINEFREDLYFRLSVLQIKIPPLRERKQDILPLTQELMSQKSHGQLQVDKEIKTTFLNYDWPGNVRELENVIERIIAVGPTSSLEMTKLLLEDQMEYGDLEAQKIEVKLGTLKDMEEQIVHSLYHLYEGNKQELADALGVSRTTLWKKIKEMNVI
ncbi:sigma 54-interacting transcriptional regulator [Ammoniphilus sp. CFH 90114]|uniref:sigma 54-interacting transcriptional regulator n=1 Tax=Ammoniphilus sp. CFH 90114 TaxID=2493665 RepID=UPI00100F869C|nr:sigma 54-interacting transcriptional regulator [Ammoniphilus sp. CFH 90114]RXT06591.1 AAA family ATPase [Ammoniphilus sp. CFH 90114]